MNDNIKFESVNGITSIFFSTIPTLEDCRLVIDKLAEDETYHLRLWDFNDLLLTFTTDEIRTIAIYGKSKFPDQNRIALVASRDLTYGTFREFDAYREEPKAYSVSRAFRTQKEAIEWLVKQKLILGI